MRQLIGRYWHTLRYLKPVQLFGRLWFRVYHPKPETGPEPPMRGITGEWSLPARRRPGLIGPETFILLGVEGALADVGWDGAGREKLWRYNQHYFDDLNAQEGDQRTDWHLSLIDQWVSANPPSQGTGWEPYPVSLRIVNWIKWALSGYSLPEPARHSLAVQARWLMRRLEVHLLGNHLFANAKALVFAGSFFEGSEADRWRRRGLVILDREVPEQILADGGHFERSTLYHALALEDMLDLCNLAGAYPDVEDLGSRLAAWKSRIPDMQTWLLAMSHPDGRVSFFNDAAFGIAPDNGELLEYSERLGFAGRREPGAESLEIQGERLGASGYVAVAMGENHKAMLDVAPVGPDYLPGHAHADTLSFELSLFGQRLLVNSGTSEYGAGPERLRQRGTAAHNTLVVDGADSSEVWSGFRVARRARVKLLKYDTGPGGITVAASHDGYRRLPGRNVHRREWAFVPGELRIVDSVTGAFDDALVRFHFHPAVRVQADGPGFVALLPTGERVRLRFEGAGPVRLEESTWHPAFGVCDSNQCLVAGLSGCELETVITWQEA